MKLPRFAFLALLALFALAMLWAAPLARADDAAFRQQAVDGLVARIGETVGTSLQAEDWRGRYRLATMNIEDLKKSLQVGGQIKSDSIAPFKAQLDELWAERYEYFTYLQGTLLRVQKFNKDAREQAVRDVGGAMLRFLTPKPGVGTLLNSARTADAEVIKRDFAEIRTTEQALKTLRGYIEDLKKNMLDLKARREGLLPVHAAFKALMGGAMDGTYVGGVMWEQNGRMLDGVFRFVVTGNDLKGNFDVLDGKSDDVVRVKRKGEMAGRVESDGQINAEVQGAGKCIGKCDDLAGIIIGALIVYPFRGRLEGRIVGTAANGTYDVHSTDNRQKQATARGFWKATRQGG